MNVSVDFVCCVQGGIENFLNFWDRCRHFIAAGIGRIDGCFENLLIHDNKRKVALRGLVVRIIRKGIRVFLGIGKVDVLTIQ